MCHEKAIASKKNKIKELRIDRGLSSRELAGLIGTSAPHTSRLEFGQSPLSIEWIGKLAGCTTRSVLTRLSTCLLTEIHCHLRYPLLGSATGWLMEAADNTRLSHPAKTSQNGRAISTRKLSNSHLNFQQTKYLAFTIIKVIRQVKGRGLVLRPVAARFEPYLDLGDLNCYRTV